MPPKRRPQEESSSDEDMAPVDFARFMNPNYAREFKAKLPAKIRDRVKALEGLDNEYKKLKLELTKKIDTVEREFQAEIKPLGEQRAALVKGQTEATEEQVQEGFPEEHKDKVKVDGKLPANPTKGIPNFWLEALQHHIIVSEFINERDAEALAYISDIRCDMSAPEEETQSFTIVFEFNENPFFTNTVLSKKFTLTRENEETALAKAEGTTVEWKEGKNLSVKTVSKKLKPKGKKGPAKFVSSEEPCETFFDFFKEGEAEDDEEWMAMAETLKDKIIPFAVEYFTGEAPDGESDLDEEDMDEEEEEEEEEDEPMPMRGGRGRGAPAPKRGGGAGGKQQECKQQ